MPDTASTRKPSATAGVTAGSPKPAQHKAKKPKMPKKVTLSLAEIVDTRGTFKQFQDCRQVRDGEAEGGSEPFPSSV
jgi:hypothetical protein